MSVWMAVTSVSLKTFVEITMAPTRAGVPLATLSMKMDTAALVQDELLNC